MPTIGEILSGQREEAAERAGVGSGDIAHARKTGIDPQDVRTFREASAAEGLVIVVRCPKLAARAWHGTLPAKTWATKKKTGESGAVVNERGQAMVSDYDLMSLWRRGGGTARKVVASAAGGAAQGRYPAEAQALIVRLNARLVTKIQHGCQDDFASAKNPGVKPTDHFSAFDTGRAVYLPGPSECAAFYSRNGFEWPYDASGRFRGEGS
jgi:hypothetical protein